MATSKQILSGNRDITFLFLQKKPRLKQLASGKQLAPDRYLAHGKYLAYSKYLAHGWQLCLELPSPIIGNRPQLSGDGAIKLSKAGQAKSKHSFEAYFI